MDVREILRHKVTAMVVIPLGVIALAVASLHSCSGSRSYRQVGKAFYTDDDGVSYFADVADRIMPFTHNGREAVGAKVELAPNSFAGRHTHPGEEITYVIDGEAEILVEGKPPLKVKGGMVSPHPSSGNTGPVWPPCPFWRIESASVVTRL